ncbi:MAG: hypothetical protein Q9M20_01600 [Mariprofundaceae bacterium]|nr:hypothetical protein [Mariprofundaceae bacterium]
MSQFISWNPESTIAGVTDNVNPLQSQSFIHKNQVRLLYYHIYAAYELDQIPSCMNRRDDRAEALFATDFLP